MTLRKLDAVGAVLSLIERVRDPRERLAALGAVRVEMRVHDERIRDQVRATVAELYAADVSIAEIARILKVTPQRAHQLAAPTQQENHASEAH